MNFCIGINGWYQGYNQKFITYTAKKITPPGQCIYAIMKNTFNINH